jgi:hypothetical protein
MARTRKKPRDIATISERVRNGTHRASELEDPFRGLVYARPKVGKTRLVATLPEVLILDIGEKGTKSVKRDLDPHVYRVRRVAEMDDLYWYLQSGDHPFQSWAIDGVTGLQTMVMRFVLGDEAERDASKDPQMPSRQIWGKVNEICREYITNFSNLPMHGCFTALERSRDMAEDDDDESQIVVGPAVTPGVANHLEGSVDTIGRLTAREVVVKKKGQEKGIRVIRRTLWLGPSEKYIAGERDGVFGGKIINPHLGRMIETIEGGNSSG